MHFPCSADHGPDWQLYPVDSYFAIYVMTMHVISERAVSTRYWDYLEDYRPCTGGLSAVNVVGTQLRNLINWGVTRWRFTV